MNLPLGEATLPPLNNSKITRSWYDTPVSERAWCCDSCKRCALAGEFFQANFTDETLKALEPIYIGRLPVELCKWVKLGVIAKVADEPEWMFESEEKLAEMGWYLDYFFDKEGASHWLTPLRQGVGKPMLIDARHLVPARKDGAE